MRSAALLMVSLTLLPSGAEPHDSFPSPATFTTLVTTPLAIEGLAADEDARLHLVGRAGVAGEPCPVWRVDGTPATLTVVGNVPAPSQTGQCSPSGLAFDAGGDLFIADGAQVYRLTPEASAPPTATVFATGVPGANGLAFDEDGNLWTGDGTTGQGRVWVIAPEGGAGTEAFRIPPMRNGTALGGAVAGDGVGRQARTFPPGTLTNTAGGQDLVANGLAFERGGDLLVADTARGALWKVEFDRDGGLRSRTGCDSTLAPNTLCLEALWVADPRLEGSDGIALDRAGNVWADANERNAVVVVTRQRQVLELFRNPPDAVTLLRNAGPLEFPTSPVLIGKRFCTASSDGNRRDNSPNSAGEASPAGAARGKISCLDQPLTAPGLPLPVK